MKYSLASKYLEKIEKTSSRLVMTDILADLIKKSGAEEIDKLLYLSLGVLAPAYRAIIFNLSEKFVIRAIGQAYDMDEKDVVKKFKELGDLGEVALTFAQNQNSNINNKNLSVVQVYDKLVEIAQEEGGGSQERKIGKLSKLLKQLDPLSAKFTARIPVGKLRLGFSDKTIIDALSVSMVGDKSEKRKIEKAYGVLSDIGLLAREIKAHGIKKATNSPKPIVGIPVLPMLAQRLKSTDEMITKMGKVAVEPKFDGVRVLIHFERRTNSKGQTAKDGDKYFVKAFTRNLNDVTQMFPELKKIGKYVIGKSVILDSEGVGIDPKTERMVDFQKTMQRKRKVEIGKASKDIPFRFQIFDIIAKDGRSFMDTPYIKRRKILEKTIRKNKLFVIDKYLVTDDPKVIKDEHVRLLKLGLEGVIVKRLDATYVPGRTGWRWVKMKEVEEAHAKLADTIDAVIMGYTAGKGKRVEFGIGQFLAGIADGESIKSISKVGTGLSDKQLKSLSKRLRKIRSRDKPKTYGDVYVDHKPDFWVEPRVVVELAADEITKSPKHSSGYALRFPRLIKFRDDKGVEQTTTIKEIKKLYKLQ